MKGPSAGTDANAICGMMGSRTKAEDTLDAREREQALVARAQAGDREAIAGLYRMFADRLYRQVLYPCAPDPATAEDLLKDTFVTMLEQLPTFRWDPARGIFPWLARIARNRAYDKHRRRATETRAAGAYVQHVEQLTRLVDPEEQLGDAQRQSANQARIKALLEQLNPRYRRAIELRLYQDLPREDCAAQLDVKVGTFDVIFYRAIQAFRKQWEQQESP